MFVEKIILEQLYLDGCISTTIVQSERGRPMLIDYAERIDIEGADFGHIRSSVATNLRLSDFWGVVDIRQKPLRDA